MPCLVAQELAKGTTYESGLGGRENGGATARLHLAPGDPLTGGHGDAVLRARAVQHARHALARHAMLRVERLVTNIGTIAGVDRAHAIQDVIAERAEPDALTFAHHHIDQLFGAGREALGAAQVVRQLL